MDETHKAKEKIKELKEVLRAVKMPVVQKDEKIQAALLKTDSECEKIIQNFMKSKQFSDLQFIQYYKGFEIFLGWTMNHHNQTVDFSNLDFKSINTEILANEAKE